MNNSLKIGFLKIIKILKIILSLFFSKLNKDIILEYL
jgi:hypothetical protein